MKQRKKSIDFIVIGAGKSGTTWLAGMLRQHPDIFIPERKELHYFNTRYGDDLNLENLNHNKPVEWYLNFFRGPKPSQIRGEVTPQYLSDPATPEGIHQFNPDIKLVAILREPIERTLSQLSYLQFRGGENDETKFKQLLQEDRYLLEGSKYFKHLAQFYKLFPKENIKVLLYDDLRKNNKKFLHDVQKFLGVSPFTPANFNEPANVTGQVRFKFINKSIRDLRRFTRKHRLTFVINLLQLLHLDRLAMNIVNINKTAVDPQKKPSPDPELLIFLAKYYSSDIKKLEGLTHLDLSSWKNKHHLLGNSD